MNTSEELLTSHEVIELLRISKSTLLRWVKEGRLPAQRAGVRLLRFRRADVMAALHPVPSSAGLEQEKADREQVARIKAARGMFAHLPGSVDEFLSEKRREAEREESRRQESGR